MNRFINQINVSITTNRTCTLRCDHCYIAPHLFDDKSQMSTQTFRKIFDQIENLYDLDGRLEEIEWEAIGGETTMMPFEWWEENLPWALDRILSINKKIGKDGALNFLTNLVYSDKRYTDLINKYGDHPAFCLYTSWEPDTGRFGKNNKLFPKFLKTLESITCKKKILDVILTREVIKLGPEYLIDTFVSRGITDFSIKMLSPYGSGKQFFKDNMIDFNSMSEYLIKLGKIKPEHITYTPQDEMRSSLFRGTSFQCNGNFQYDLAIEPDGSCTFNANQTADEAVIGTKTVNIYDPDWAQKVIYENKREENNKLSLSHPACGQCEFMRYCNAGWYHYKIHDPQEIRVFDKDDCSGYKKMWLVEKESMKAGLYDISTQLHRSSIARKVSGDRSPQEGSAAPVNSILESSLPKSYNDFFAAFGKRPVGMAVELDMKRKFNKSIEERVWFYESLGVDVLISSMEHLSPTIIEHWLYRNFKGVHLNLDQVVEWINRNEDHDIAIFTKQFIAAWKSAFSDEDAGRKLIMDSRNEELFRTVIDLNLGDMISTEDHVAVQPSEYAYISRLKLFTMIESGYGK